MKDESVRQSFEGILKAPMDLVPSEGCTRHSDGPTTERAHCYHCAGHGSTWVQAPQSSSQSHGWEAAQGSHVPQSLHYLFAAFCDGAVLWDPVVFCGGFASGRDQGETEPSLTWLWKFAFYLWGRVNYKTLVHFIILDDFYLLTELFTYPIYKSFILYINPLP